MKFYRARVMHRRMDGVGYRFAYRVFNLLLDLDGLDDDVSRRRLLSRNRFNLLSFHDCDHGPRDGSALRPWVEAVLAREAGIDLEGGRVRLLCMPRVLGYGFNPLSLWYCEHRDGSLRAVLCEVHNTFGESHGYLLHRDGAQLPWPVTGYKEKRFHVSPLLPMSGAYRFRLGNPDRSPTIAITEFRSGERVLSAAWSGQERPATDAQFVLACLVMPLMSLKVLAMIHWQALRIWLRGASFHRKPAPPERSVT